MTATLYTFPPSLDCELDRFLLSHYAVPYSEERHALLFSPLVTLLRGRTILFPLYCEGNVRLSNSREVIDHFDPRAPMDKRLLRDGAERKQVESDWLRFNRDLGFASATFSYFHLLKERSIMIRPLSEGTPELEQRSVELGYPLYAGVLRLLLRLTPAHAQQSLATAREIIDTVDKRLADGRRYLVGDRFSLSDMAFAVSTAPLVLVDGYGGPLPPLDDMPAAIKTVVAEMREHPAGQFALRIYREHRHGAAAVQGRTATSPRSHA